MRVEDLKDTGRLLVLLVQAIARDLVSSSDADRLRFVGAAEHAMAVGEENPPGLFMYLVRGHLWRYLTQEDEDRAHARIKRELRGEPPVRSGVGSMAFDGSDDRVGDRPEIPSRSGVGSMASSGGPGLSADGLIVREVRAAMIRAGIFRDPFAAFRGLNPDWTRPRWDAALAELERVRLMS